jgi:DnaK suppressor protein
VQREQPPEFKNNPEAEQPVAVRTLPQTRQHVGIEKIDEVLEEIWNTADRESPMAHRGWYADLLRYIRATLIRVKDDAFGSCLCCKATIGLRRQRTMPWTPLCIRCQEAADHNDAEVLKSRSRLGHRSRLVSRGTATK